MALAVFLASDQSGTLSGRPMSAVGDDVANLSPRMADLMASEHDADGEHRNAVQVAVQIYYDDAHHATPC